MISFKESQAFRRRMLNIWELVQDFTIVPRAMRESMAREYMRIANGNLAYREACQRLRLDWRKRRSVKAGKGLTRARMGKSPTSTRRDVPTPCERTGGWSSASLSSDRFFRLGELLMRPRNAVHYCLEGVNQVFFPICGTLHRACLKITQSVGRTTCQDCERCLIEAGVLPDPGGQARARLSKRDVDDDGDGPDVDDVGIPFGIMAKSGA